MTCDCVREAVIIETDDWTESFLGMQQLLTQDMHIIRHLHVHDPVIRNRSCETTAGNHCFAGSN